MNTTTSNTNNVYGAGDMMRGENLPDRLDDDQKRRPHQHGRHRGCRHRLGPAITVRMVGVGRSIADGDAAPDNDRACDVARRLDAVGDQRVRMAEDACGQLHARQNRVGGESQQGRRNTSLNSARLHAATKAYLRHARASIVRMAF